MSRSPAASASGTLRSPECTRPSANTASEVLKPTADEMALLDRRDVPKPPKRVWTAELFVFLGQPGTISALMILGLIGAMAGVMVRVARQFNPVAGGE